MQLFNNLLLIAMMIEVWHIVYYSYFKQYYFDRSFQVVTWAQDFKKMYESLMKYSNHYANNEELQNALPELCTPMLGMVDAFQQGGGVSHITSKILQVVPMRDLVLFLIQQGIEVVYWIMTFVFIFITPNYGGILLFAVIFLLSKFQKYFNKDNRPALHITDSLICICMYAMFGYFY